MQLELQTEELTSVWQAPGQCSDCRQKLQGIPRGPSHPACEHPAHATGTPGTRGPNCKREDGRDVCRLQRGSMMALRPLNQATARARTRHVQAPGDIHMKGSGMSTALPTHGRRTKFKVPFPHEGCAAVALKSQRLRGPCLSHRGPCVLTTQGSQLSIHGPPCSHSSGGRRPCTCMPGRSL